MRSALGATRGSASLPRRFNITHGTCELSAMVGFAGKPLAKSSIADLLALAKRSPEERAVHLHETMKVGLARCALRLFEMPFGFCNAPSIKKVQATYVHNFRQVLHYEHNSAHRGFAHADYTELTKNIFEAHRGTMLDIAKGVFEYNEYLAALFGSVNLAEIRDEVRAIRDVEDALDQFFTDRLTLRLLGSHTHSLSRKTAPQEGNGSQLDMVGVVNVNTKPIVILSRAYMAVRFMCKRDYDLAPDLQVNGVCHDEYISAGASTQHFPYVHTHLFYIFLELVKNAARASAERALQEHTEAGGRGVPVLPVLRVDIPEDQRIWGLERSVKLADRGTGMSRGILNKAFSYYFSSAKGRPNIAEEMGDFDRRVPLAGFGFGLPVSRVMARYFGGDLDLNSMPGNGTDVYIYL